MVQTGQVSLSFLRLQPEFDQAADGFGVATEAAKGSRGSDPRLLGLTMGRLLDRTFGVRPRASRIVHAIGLDQPSIT
jgi:hypothetical protein